MISQQFVNAEQTRGAEYGRQQVGMNVDDHSRVNDLLDVTTQVRDLAYY